MLAPYTSRYVGAAVIYCAIGFSLPLCHVRCNDSFPSSLILSYSSFFYPSLILYLHSIFQYSFLPLSLFPSNSFTTLSSSYPLITYHSCLFLLPLIPLSHCILPLSSLSLLVPFLFFTILFLPLFLIPIPCTLFPSPYPCFHPIIFSSFLPLFPIPILFCFLLFPPHVHHSPMSPPPVSVEGTF